MEKMFSSYIGKKKKTFVFFSFYTYISERVRCLILPRVKVNTKLNPVIYDCWANGYQEAKKKKEKVMGYCWCSGRDSLVCS